MSNNKNNVKSIIISSLACLIPAVVSLLIWDRLPDEIATSFGFNGEVNEYMPKFNALIGASFYLLFMHLVVIISIKIDPLKNNNSDKIKNKMIYFMPIFSNVVMGLIIAYSLDFNIDMNRAVFLMISVLFIVMGNFLPKCKKNYTIGIRTPWTLNSDDNWFYTHRLSGKIWFYTGIIGLINAITLNSVAIFFVILAITCFAPTCVSYYYFSKYENLNNNIGLDE